MLEITLPLNVEDVYEVVGAIGSNPESYPVEDAMLTSPDSSVLKVGAEPPVPNQFTFKAGVNAVVGESIDVTGAFDALVGPGSVIVPFTVRVTFAPPVSAPNKPDTARLKFIRRTVV